MALLLLDKDMEIELLFRNGDGEHSPFSIQVTDALYENYQKLGIKVVIEANYRTVTMYLDKKDSGIVLHVPMALVPIAVEKIVELGLYLFPSVVVDIPTKSTNKPKRVRK